MLIQQRSDRRELHSTEKEAFAFLRLTSRAKHAMRTMHPSACGAEGGETSHTCELGRGAWRPLRGAGLWRRLGGVFPEPQHLDC